ADEALMLNTAGEVACAAAANLFWVEAGALVTPALECGVLDGIVRARLIALARAAGAEVREVRVGADALGGAEGLFLTNSLIGVRPVASLDGLPVPSHRLLQAAAGWIADVA
ncbi:MAG TPA: aminotransferase class IV, partial [Caulobacteraceae bacterium]|nr:aminotransferase class IV [Caulobacteraceae bacterium]